MTEISATSERWGGGHDHVRRRLSAGRWVHLASCGLQRRGQGDRAFRTLKETGQRTTRTKGDAVGEGRIIVRGGGPVLD